MVRNILFFIGALCLSSLSYATGIAFFEGSFAEAKELAGQEGKLIFVDAYTTWCGPCKRMSKNVFTKDDVGAFYNSTFVNVKLDMEKGEGRDFQRQYRVSAFPTLLFINAEGKVVHRVVGGMDVPNFLKLGKFAASKSDVSSGLQKAYDEGDRSPEFMAQYVRALAKTNQPRVKTVNEYLRDQQDLETKENLTVMFYGAQEADSRIFNLLMKHRKKATALFGEEAMAAQIEKAATATVDKAVEFGNPDLVEEAIDKVNRYAPKSGKAFSSRARMRYYQGMNDMGNYLKHAKEYARLGTTYKFELANTILHHMKKKAELVRWAEKWAVQAAEEESNEQHHFVAAQLGYINGNYKVAKEHADKAKTYAEANKSQTLPHIQRFMKSLNQKIGVDKS